LDESLLRNQDPRTDRTQQSGVDLAEISIDLFNRLLKTAIIRATPGIKTLHDRKVVVLDANSTARHQNGLLFASYLIVLKEVLYKVNQDFSIDDQLPNKLKEQSTPQARLFNWNYLCNELDVSTIDRLRLNFYFFVENWNHHRKRHQKSLRRR
jgi:hypothetical protein